MPSVAPLSRRAEHPARNGATPPIVRGAVGRRRTVEGERSEPEPAQAVWRCLGPLTDPLEFRSPRV
jgi:hypothetical protein